MERYIGRDMKNTVSERKISTNYPAGAEDPNHKFGRGFGETLKNEEALAAKDREGFYRFLPEAIAALVLTGLIVGGAVTYCSHMDKKLKEPGAIQSLSGSINGINELYRMHENKVFSQKACK